MKVFLQILFGFLSGILGGMGMGGGTLLIPLLTIFLNVEQKVAQATNLLVFVPMAIFSLLLHTKNKLVEYKIGIFVMIGGVCSSVVSALLIASISSGTLKLCFGIFLIAIGVFQTISVFVNKNNEKKG